MTNTLPTPDVLTVYGASWCWDCRNTRRYLDSTGAQYRYVDSNQMWPLRPCSTGPGIAPFRS